MLLHNGDCTVEALHTCTGQAAVHGHIHSVDATLNDWVCGAPVCPFERSCRADDKDCAVTNDSFLVPTSTILIMHRYMLFLWL
jgi:hypothetical protein